MSFIRRSLLYAEQMSKYIQLFLMGCSDGLCRKKGPYDSKACIEALLLSFIEFILS